MRGSGSPEEWMIEDWLVDEGATDTAREEVRRIR